MRDRVGDCLRWWFRLTQQSRHHHALLEPFDDSQLFRSHCSQAGHFQLGFVYPLLQSRLYGLKIS
jgi:hypothetical protein